MILWIAIALMTGSALLAVVMPLLRRRPAPASARAHDLAVYRDQLAEVERDRASGLINNDEAAAARLEIERRILRQGNELEPRPGGDSRPLRLATAALLVVAVPALALGLYLRLGSPDLPDLPLAGRQQAAPAGAEDPASLAAELERRLADGSGTLGEWVGLARSLMTAGKPADAARAYRRATELAPQRAELISAYGEALVESSDGSVVPPAREAFERALAIDPAEPRARFYRGAFLMQQGDLAAAIDLWLQLELDSSPDAPWLAVLEERLGEAARAANVDLVKRRAELQPSPTQPGNAPATAPVDPTQRGAMIRTMVDGLAERLKHQPDDLEGWRRLARSYTVLGERDKAVQAQAEAVRLAPDRVDVLLDYAHALYSPGKATGPVPAEFTRTMRRILALAPAHAEALFFVGEAEAEAGNPASAVDLWRKLLAQLDPTGPTYAAIQKRIDGLSTSN